MGSSPWKMENQTWFLGEQGQRVRHKRQAQDPVTDRVLVPRELEGESCGTYRAGAPRRLSCPSLLGVFAVFSEAKAGPEPGVWQEGGSGSLGASVEPSGRRRAGVHRPW